MKSTPVLAALVFAVLSSAAPAEEKVLIFDILEGVIPGKTEPYTGAMALRTRGGVVDLEWKLSDGSSYKGIGLQEPKKFLAGGYASAGGSVGVTVYKISGGKLDGRWTESGDKSGKTGVEVLEGPEGLEGSYKITTGLLPDGKTPYSGTVKIAKNGKTRQFAWTMKDGTSYQGIGVGDEAFYVVAWNRTGKVGVVVYPRMNGDEMSGFWAAGDSGLVGTERLKLKSGPPAKTDEAKPDPELAKAISADLKLCAEIAQKYLDAVVASDFDAAAALLCKAGLNGRTKEEAAAGIRKEINIVGGIKSYMPIKSGTDFGVKDGVVNFSLSCHIETGKGRRKLLLKFIKEEKGVGLLGTN